MTEPTELLPCPFCGAGESQIHVNKGTWNGRGYGEPVSVEVRHWCADVPGQPSRMISRAGRDEASAIAAWNTRTTPQPTQSELRRLHTENALLQAGYDAARLEIDHLRGATKMMEPAQPEAWLVYLPSIDTQHVYDSQDDMGYLDDLTNHADAEVIPLYPGTAPKAEVAPAGEYPAGAIANGRTHIDRLESHYRFDCEAGPLSNCGDWHGLKRCFEHLADCASRGQAPAPAATGDDRPSETVKFVDESTADPVEKARRYLKAMGDPRMNSAYFFDDGYPRRESSQDALATLAVLEQLSAAPQTDRQPAVQQWNDLIGKETHADADGLLVWRDEVDFAIPTPQADSQPARDYLPLPDFDAVEQHIYGACRRYIPQDMLEPIHNLIRDAIDADRAQAAGSVTAPLSDAQWQRIADLTDSILTRSVKDEIERVIGIKGGQHGTE